MSKRVVAIIKKGPAFMQQPTRKEDTWLDLVIKEELDEYCNILNAVQTEQDKKEYRQFKKQYNQAKQLGWI